MTSPSGRLEHRTRPPRQEHSSTVNTSDRTQREARAFVPEERADKRRNQENPPTSPQKCQTTTSRFRPSPRRRGPPTRRSRAHLSWSPSSFRSSAPTPSSRSGEFDQVKRPFHVPCTPLHRCATSRDCRPPLAGSRIQESRSLVSVSLLASVSSLASRPRPRRCRKLGAQCPSSRSLLCSTLNATPPGEPAVG
jgi:hypothetical protein